MLECPRTGLSLVLFPSQPVLFTICTHSVDDFIQGDDFKDHLQANSQIHILIPDFPKFQTLVANFMFYNSTYI